MNSIEKVANSAYAFVLAKYISELEEPHRFLVLGFRDILEDLSIHFKSACQGDLIKPTGKLEEISNLRRTLSPCLIALDWEDVGKYASWTTSFKILTESPLKTIGSSRRDVHDPIDVITWLSKRNDVLDQILRFTCKELSTTFKPTQVEAVKCLLAEIRRSIQKSRSFAELFHPRKIIEAITVMVHRQELHEDAKLGHFLRKIGMEPSSELSEIPFFGDKPIPEETLRKYLKKYQQVLRSFLTAPYEKGTGKLRKSLAVLGLNLLRHLLVIAAEKEINEQKRTHKKWTAFFLEFEQAKKEKRTRKRKYGINLYGTAVLNRSPASGLPTRIRFVLERSLEFGEDNILYKFFQNELSALLTQCSKTSGHLDFSLSATKMLSANTLILELTMEDGGLTVVDPYFRGLKAPVRKINNLLSRLGGE